MSNAPATRLGRRELGQYASEERMPERLHAALLKEDDSNSLPAVIPKLCQLLSHDTEIEIAYLCTDTAVQVYKLPDEGAHFCGYRNMQMLCLGLQQVSGLDSGKVDFNKKLSILDLQDMIEQAWSRGINSEGRVQTGGIKGTRKHVGSPEAEALLRSLNIPCTGSSFSGKDAWRKLLDYVELYFSNGREIGNTQAGVITTSRPPIFLQRPRHSITMVGFERLRSGKRRLLVFDPAWRPPSAMRGDIAEQGRLRWREVLVLARYRLSERSLKRFNVFETVNVSSSTCSQG